MKKILITGKNSYIGKSFAKWVSKYSDNYSIDLISVRDDKWSTKDFTGYDVVYHTAAIVHIKENDTSRYFEINRDLTINLAKKGKLEGVKHFIFLSTMGVYGTETGNIMKDTVPVPNTPYAKSKYEAEQLLLELESINFNVSIIRPPIVYGDECPGNYIRLASMALKLPFFPDIENKRSMIYIDNLSEFVRLLIDNGVGGMYFPQNKDYINTTELVNLIAKAHGKRIKTLKSLNWCVSIGCHFLGTFRKVFGTFVYEKTLMGSPGTLINGKSLDYETVSFEESIKRTENVIN
jgi:UDP-glucose 4-epimerase